MNPASRRRTDSRRAHCRTLAVMVGILHLELMPNCQCHRLAASQVFSSATSERNPTTHIMDSRCLSGSSSCLVLAFKNCSLETAKNWFIKLSEATMTCQEPEGRSISEGGAKKTEPQDSKGSYKITRTSRSAV